MPGRFYPTVAEALAMHRELVAEFGGSRILMDRGRLEAAIFRPQIGYYDRLESEAAALMESLANNHPFQDGNKRISFAVADAFLRMNGFELDVEAEAAYQFITESLSRGEFRFLRILEWIDANIRPLSG
jgi:death-on-curing protein